MWRIGSTLEATTHYATFRASFCSNHLRQPISCKNGKLRQLNMIFSRLNILSRVIRIRMTAFSWSEKYLQSIKTPCHLFRSFRNCLMHKMQQSGKNKCLDWEKWALTDCRNGWQCVWAHTFGACNFQLLQGLLRSALWLSDMDFEIMFLLSLALWWYFQYN